MKDSSKKTEDALFSMDKTINNLSDKLVAYFAFTQLVNLGKRIIEVTSEFQKFEAVLTNTLGSNVAAQVAMQKVADIAAKTNFSVKELTDSYIKFANRGVKLTTQELTKLADLSNSTGKSFDQLTEAVLDAFTGENERLKEFGITAKKTGDTTKFTFKGITTEVKNTQAAISAYLFSLGALNGVQGSTAKIAQTLNGQISNLGDALDQLAVTVGNGVNGPFSGLLSFLTSYVQWVQNALKTTQQFNDELSTSRADKFVERFKTMNTEVQKATVQRLQLYVDAQAELLIVERKAREKAQQEANEAYIGEAGIQIEIQKSAREKELELTLQTNIKKIQLIKNFYDEQAKIVDKEESGIISRLQKSIKALEKERELSNSRARIEQLNKQIDAGHREMAVLLGQEKDFQLKKLDIKTQATDQDFGLKDIYNKRVKQDSDYEKKLEDETSEYLIRKAQEKEARIQALRQATFDLSSQFINALFEVGRDRNQAALDDSNAKRDEELKRVGDNKQAQSFINAKFDREQAALKKKQAIADKANAIFGIIINTAESVIKTGAQLGYPAAIPFQIFAAAAGAIQAAVVAARPIPKFAKGTEYLHGQGGVDSNLIYADTGERIVPKTINRDMMGIQNSELPRLAAMYRAEPMARAELREMIRAQRETTSAIKQIKVERTHITERGLQKVVEQGNARTKVLNEQFSFPN